MAELINREDAIEAVQQLEEYDLIPEVKVIGKGEAIEAIEGLRTAEVIPQPARCMVGRLQVHDNGMVSMRIESWQMLCDQIERVKKQADEYFDAIYGNEKGNKQ